MPLLKIRWTLRSRKPKSQPRCFVSLRDVPDSDSAAESVNELERELREDFDADVSIDGYESVAKRVNCPNCGALTVGEYSPFCDLACEARWRSDHSHAAIHRETSQL